MVQVAKIDRMDLWIGASGYVYPEWVGPFYPPATSSIQMLPFYARSFPLVELNFTYYKMPAADHLAKMARRVPASFQFIVKAHRSLTHERMREQIPVFHAAVQPMRERGQLMGVLCQFPQSFHCVEANRRWLTTLRQELKDLPIAVEFRHHSWDQPDLVDWLCREGLSLVSVDVPDIAALFLRKLVQAGRQVYVRLHSRDAGRWYAAGHERYDYLYSDEELQEWLDALAARVGRIDRALVLFNNCRNAQAVIDARQLAALASRRADLFQVIGPSDPGTQQGMLF
jgi:uncharacterized protein YecE (DUF72 family)